MKHEPTCKEIFLIKLGFVLRGKAVYRSFADRLPLEGGERVLDFGCGMGAVAYYVAKKLPRGTLTCLDISERWLKECRKTLRRFESVTCIRWESTVLEKESYDVVYCHFALHELTDAELQNVIRVLAGALRTGGTLVCREPLSDTKKINAVRRLTEQNALSLMTSNITDVPLIGNTLERVYIKK